MALHTLGYRMASGEHVQSLTEWLRS